MAVSRAAWLGTGEQGEAVAIRALGFVTGNPAELGRFLSRSGLSPGDLKRHPVYPRHLVAILDFLITNEPALLKFAQMIDAPPEAAYEARRLLRDMVAQGLSGEGLDNV